MPDPSFPLPTPAASPSDEAKLSVVALRERKKDQTREALARAAFRLFRDKGYEATTVAEIARAANVSRRTFFRYFSTKDALLFVDDADHLERFRELLAERRPGDSVFVTIRHASLALAREIISERERVLARGRIIDASSVLSKQERQQDLQWEQAIAQSLTAKLQNPSSLALRRAQMLAGALFGGLRSAIAEWHRVEGHADLERLICECLELFERVNFELERPSTCGQALEN